MNMPVFPTDTIDRDRETADSDEAVLASCELALDETTEKLQAYLENSGLWLETVLLTTGFYLLSIAVKAPEEFEILGSKISVPGDHRELFLTLIGIALVFRIIQSWMMSKLHADRIDRSFHQVRRNLLAARDLMTSQEQENKRLMNKFIGEITDEGKLPKPHSLFDDGGVHPTMDASRKLREVPLTASAFRQALVDQFLTRRNDLVMRQLDDRYPIDEWTRAADAVIAESLARHQVYFAPTAVVSVFKETEDIAPTISAAELYRLAQAREDAFKSLEIAMGERSARYQYRLNRSSERLDGLAKNIGKVLNKVKFYRWAVKGGHLLHLVLPSFAAALASGVVVFNRY